MRWSEEITKKFVIIYLKHECLWNPSHPGYKLRLQREKAYAAIVSEFNAYSSKSLSIPEVRVKIKNLRSTYIQEVHKILQKSSPDAMYEPSLGWFRDMDRCLKYIPSRNSSVFSGPVIAVTSEVDTSTEIWVEPESQISNTVETDSDPLVPQIDDEYDTGKQETILQFKKERLSPVPFKKVKKRKIKKRTSSLADYMNSNVEVSTSTGNENEDEFDIYGKFIASQLRHMELQKALRLQMEIHNLVNEARMTENSIVNN